MVSLDMNSRKARLAIEINILLFSHFHNANALELTAECSNEPLLQHPELPSLSLGP